MVSIIIVNYNTFDLTCDCIRSIIEIEKELDKEIILVDNGSIEKPVSLFKEIFPEIVLIESTLNLGFSKANNLGIQKCQGEYILLLNSDALLKNEAISKAYKFLIQDESLAVVSARLEYPDGTIQHNCQRFPSIKYQFIEFLRLQKLSKSIKQSLYGSFFDYKSVAYPDWVWGTFFMFKKSLLQKLPGRKLDDSFFMYGEDMQWCLDFKRLGYKIAFTPDAQVVHLMGASSGNKEKLMQEHLDIFMKKNYTFWERVIIYFLNKMLSV